MKRTAVPVAVPPSQALPSALSPSRAKDFLDCELRFYFSVVERWRTPPTEHTVLGNVVHAAVEALYRAPAADRDRRRAQRCLEVAWSEAAADPQNEVVLSDRDLCRDLDARSSAAMDGLFALEQPQAIEVEQTDIEAWTEANLFGAPVRGRIDRMTRTPVWRVTDYKTGKVPAAAYVESALAGLFTYAATLAASHADKQIPEDIELLYLLGPARIRRPVLRTYLLDHARRLSAAWAAIAAANSAGVWTARTGPLCGWCPFSPACPVVTKNAPPVGSDPSRVVLAALGLDRQESSMPTPDVDRDPDRDAAEEAAGDAGETLT